MNLPANCRNQRESARGHHRSLIKVVKIKTIWSYSIIQSRPFDEIPFLTMCKMESTDPFSPSVPPPGGVCSRLLVIVNLVYECP